MNEKAVSPLIATIFLIAVSVALGSIVMSLGQDYVNQAASKPLSGCTGVSYDIKNVNYVGNNLDIAIDNTGSQIDGLIIKLFNKDYTQGYTETVNQVISSLDVKVIRMIIDPVKISNIYEIKIVPKAKDEICNSAFKQIKQGTAVYK